MDKRDAVAVVGATKSQAADFIVKNYSNGYISEEIQDRLQKNSEFRLSTAGRYPETSDKGPADWGYVIATSTNDDPMANFPYSKAHEQYGCNSLSEFVALNIFHGMGHTAGISHAYSNYG